MTPDALTLEGFPMREAPPRMVPGQPERDGMDAFTGHHPCRCLPLTMANTTGRELLCPFGFEAGCAVRRGGIVEGAYRLPDLDRADTQVMTPLQSEREFGLPII